MKVSFIDYCRQHRVDHKEAVNTYVTMIAKINEYLKFMGLTGKVDIDHTLLREAIIDFYVDIIRIKTNHPIRGLSLEKAFAYKAYWLLRRKVLYVNKPFPNCAFINENFVAFHIIAVSKRAMGITDKQISMNKYWKKFKDLLYRSLKFRYITQQSIELMVEAFFCGCGFIAGGNTE